MSLSLLCPNCRREIGVIDHSDQYKYFYKNDKGEPICPTCGTGESYNGHIFVGVIIAIIAVIIIASYA